MRKKPVRQGMILGAPASALLGVLLLSNCTTIDSAMAPIGGTGGSTPPTNQKTATIGTGPGAQASDIDCPGVTILSGTAALQIPQGVGATEIRYQGSMGQLARECAILGETMTMRVGIEGRLLVGPKGGPGNVNVPIRLSLVQEGSPKRTIVSKFYSLPVSIPAGASQAIFSHVEDDLTFAMPTPASALERYVVYVGFDPRGAAAEKGKGAPKKSTAPAAPVAAKPKPKPAPAATAKSAPPAQQQPQSGGFGPPPAPKGGGSQDDLFAPPPGHRGS